jgi:hypothetical protein
MTMVALKLVLASSNRSCLARDELDYDPNSYCWLGQPRRSSVATNSPGVQEIERRGVVETNLEISTRPS